MSLLLDDVYTYLTSAGATSSSWPLYKSYMPDEQDQCMAVFETGGFPADTLARENEIVTFQVRVRGTRRDYVTARAKWKQLFDLLQDSTPASGYAYCQAMHFGPLGFNDPSGRCNFTSNFKVMRTRS